MPSDLELRYGMNPHQVPAFVAPLGGEQLPFRVLNGGLGYINLLDALKGWQLVCEITQATALPAACALKHTNPVGAAWGCRSRLRSNSRPVFRRRSSVPSPPRTRARATVILWLPTATSLH